MFSHSKRKVKVTNRLEKFITLVNTSPEGDFAVDLSLVCLNNSDATTIANVIQSGACNHMVSLDLSNNNIRVEGVRALVAALKQCPAGFSLSLQNNPLDDEAAMLFSKIIKHSAYPDNFKLDISACEFTLIGVRSLIDSLAGLQRYLTIEFDLDIYDSSLGTPYAHMEEIQKELDKVKASNARDNKLFLNYISTDTLSNQPPAAKTEDTDSQHSNKRRKTF